MIGKELSHFKITAKLGEGGMGEVYRAEDSKLGREVAIKVLPEAVASDPERLARFEREAKVLASLNHPHIAVIYSFESAESTHFLVMELVEGEDLAERLQRGAISVDEALPIAVQITEALGSAHEQGIIHRDLKPANIKITPEGAVKVLDFGLAKALDAGSDTDQNQPPLSLSPTLTAGMTQAGVLLGTAAYMAPEQAKGIAVDKRADIWAFGVLLFEMLMGGKLFAGDSVAETLAGVIKTEVDFADLPSELPASIRGLMRHCLVRDLRDRLHDIADARIVIEDVLTGQIDEPAAAAPDLPALHGRWKTALPYSLAIIGLAFGLLFWWRPWMAQSAAESPTPDIQFELLLPEEVTLASGLALSPDGTKLAYVARGADGRTALWVRPLDSIEARPLGGTVGAVYPFWSPDGLQIGFFSDNQLRVTDLISNSPRAIATTSSAANVRGASWSSDDTIVFAPTFTGPLRRISTAGGETEPATRLLEGGEIGTHRFPEFLGDQLHFVLYSSRGSGTEPGMLLLGELGTLDTVPLGPSSSRAVFAAPDHLIYVRGEALVAHRFDLDSSSLVGEPEVLGITLPGSLNVSGYRSLSVSGSEVVAFRHDTRGTTELTWVDRSGRELSRIAADREAWQYAPRLSPDGRRLIVARFESSPNQGDLWIHDLDRGIADRIQLETGDESIAVWSPDQQFIAYDSWRPSPPYGLYLMPVGRPGEERLLIETSGLPSIGCFTADGKSVVYGQADDQGVYHLWLLAIDGDGQPLRLFPEPAAMWSASLSPDGEWIAYTSDVTGQEEVYVRRLDGTGTPSRASTSGGGEPLWRRDGLELFYVNVAGEIVALSVAPGEPLGLGQPEILLQARFENTGERQYDASPDGQRFLLNQVTSSTSEPIVVTSNWRRVLTDESSRK